MCRPSLPVQFMDLRTRYTALVTLTTQHVKYISDALRRLEEEEVRALRGAEPHSDHPDLLPSSPGLLLCFSNICPQLSVPPSGCVSGAAPESLRKSGTPLTQFSSFSSICRKWWRRKSKSTWTR